MKRTITLIAVLAFLPLWGGCNAVNVSPEYGMLIDATAAWSRAMADKAAAGEMTGPEMAEALDVSADLWEDFQTAKNGVATKGGDR